MSIRLILPESTSLLSCDIKYLIIASLTLRVLDFCWIVDCCWIIFRWFSIIFGSTTHIVVGAIRV
jgi:hypothetical protein